MLASQRNLTFGCRLIEEADIPTRRRLPAPRISLPIPGHIGSARWTRMARRRRSATSRGSAILLGHFWRRGRRAPRHLLQPSRRRVGRQASAAIFRAGASTWTSASTRRCCTQSPCSAKNVTYINVSPAAHTRRGIEALRFKRFCDGTMLFLPALSRPPTQRAHRSISPPMRRRQRCCRSMSARSLPNMPRSAAAR